MGEIVLKIPQKIVRTYDLTEEYAAQVLAELDLKLRKPKSDGDESERLNELKFLMLEYRENHDASVRQAIKTGERLRARWQRK